MGRDLGARSKKLLDEKGILEQQLLEAREEAAALRKQAAEAAALAEQRARDKAVADKEWGRKLGGRDKELAGRVKDLEQRLQGADERSECVTCMVTGAA